MCNIIPAPNAKLILYSVLTSPIVTVTVGKMRKFFLHSELLTGESERFSKALNGKFKEASENAIPVDDEDPNLFGFFVEYLYRDCAILSNSVQDYATYVTLARLYALGERLAAPKFQSYVLWRFTQSLGNISISEESTCELLRIACTEITERRCDDPMRSHIFWYAGTKITTLQKFDMFRQLLCDVSDVGKHLCLWMGRSRPEQTTMQSNTQKERFAPESEYDLQSISEFRPEVESSM